MTNDPLYKRLLESGWQRKLTGEEETALHGWLAAHPEAQPDWELESAVNEALGRLPEAPVSGNFTARVLQAVELDAAVEARRRQMSWSPLRWLPRMAVAAVVLGAGLISYEQIQANRNRERVQAVRMVSEVSSLPGPEVLKDFDAIQALSQTPPADEELLAALK